MVFLNDEQRHVFEQNMPRELQHADIWMISGCQDSQTSADISNVGSFQLPDVPNGQASGACTAALLKVLYDDVEQHPDQTYTFLQVLDKMRAILKQKGFQQIPQLSSTKPIDMSHAKFELVPEHLQEGGGGTTKRAVLIGINYKGHKHGQLSGCHNDVFNMYNYIQEYYGFQDDDIVVLVDDEDGDHTPPTKANILNAYKHIVSVSQPGDSIFLHYSGHGTKVKDINGDEEDGYDEALCPLDFQTSGLILDDELNDIIVKKLPVGVHVVALYDCCHSGTVLDLPYEYKANGQYSRMEISSNKFNFNKLFGIGGGTGGVNNINLQQAMKLGKMVMGKKNQVFQMANNAKKVNNMMKQFMK